MKICPTCNAQLPDDATFCSACGTPIAPAAPEQAAPNQQAYAYAPPAAPYAAPVVNQYDHTAEFDAQDISDNKCFAMLVYLTGVIGIIVALLASHDSEYLKFHIRQAIKLMVCMILCAIICVIPFLGWIVGGVCMGIIGIVEIICFFQVCSNKAVEAPIVRGIKFLK